VSENASAPWPLPTATAARLAHELANPAGIAELAAQQLQVQLADFHALLQRLGGEDLEPEIAAVFSARFAALAEQLDTVRAANSRLLGLAAELRAQGQGRPDAQAKLDLAARLQAALQLAAAGAQPTPEVCCSSITPVYCSAPAAVLDRILLNLALNSVQAIARRAAGDPAAPRGRIEGRCGIADGRAWIEIEDNGSGISEADRARVFEPGFTRRADSGGSGLGLAYCREAARALGGDVSLVECAGSGSDTGTGACFRLWLPLPAG
jgi:signal transduction histidine kinase